MFTAYNDLPNLDLDFNAFSFGSLTQDENEAQDSRDFARINLEG